MLESAVGICHLSPSLCSLRHPISELNKTKAFGLGRPHASGTSSPQPGILKKPRVQPSAGPPCVPWCGAPAVPGPMLSSPSASSSVTLTCASKAKILSCRAMSSASRFIFYWHICFLTKGSTRHLGLLGLIVLISASPMSQCHFASRPVSDCNCSQCGVF